MTETIYLRLLNEGIDVWRPVKAMKLSENRYLILLENIVPESETWEFLPGSVVLVTDHKVENNLSKVAIRQLQNSI